MRKTILFIFYLLLIVFFVSCRTVPVTVPENIETLPLEPGGLAYFLVDAAGARPIFEPVYIPGLNPDHFKQIIERTIYAAAAVFPQGNKMRFQLSARGRYPAARIRTALRFSRGWRRHRSPVSNEVFWHSAGTGISVAVDSRRILVAAAADNTVVIDPYAAAGVAFPEGFGEFQRSSVISLWHENAGPMINQQIRQMGVPIPIEVPVERFFISLFPMPEQQEAADAELLYQAVLRLQAPDASRAVMLMSVFVLARNFISPNVPAGAGGFAAIIPLLFANPPERRGNNIDITGTLSGEEISLLINAFLLD